MISVNCDSCGKTYNLKPELAGKKATCTCGNKIRVPIGDNAVAVIRDKASCKQCGMEIKSDWKACPSCGLPIAGSNLAIQASPDRPSGLSVQSNPAEVSVAPKPTPILNVGNESVVKAEIDNSTNVQYHGQVVGQQNIQTTVIQEHAVGSLIRNLKGSFSGSKNQNSDQEEFASLPDEIKELVNRYMGNLVVIGKDFNKKIEHESRFFSSVYMRPNSKKESLHEMGLTNSTGMDAITRKHLAEIHLVGEKIGRKGFRGADKNYKNQFEILESLSGVIEACYRDLCDARAKKHSWGWVAAISAIGGLYSVLGLMGSAVAGKWGPAFLCFIALSVFVLGGGAWSYLLYQRCLNTFEEKIDKIKLKSKKFWDAVRKVDVLDE